MSNAIVTFGCEKEDLIAMMEDWVGMKDMIAPSILSDAQEELARGNIERANQFINRAKFVISKLMEEKLTNQA